MNTLADYPPHIYEPLRRKIAEGYIQHELRKLFPSLRDGAIWERIDGDVAQWFDNSPTLLPVRDFWNGFEGISAGFKLKKITAYLTSKNMRWSERELPVNDLWFGTTFRYFGEVGEMPPAKAVTDYIFAPTQREILEQARRNLAEIEKQTASRDHYPIIVTFIKSKYHVVDGNRRLFKGIIKKQKSIPAVLGEAIGEPEIFEQWVSTQVLLNLTDFHRYQMSLGNNVTEAVAGVVAEMIKDSTAGQIEWLNRCLSRSDKYDVRLWQKVGKIYKGWGRELGEIKKD